MTNMGSLRGHTACHLYFLALALAPLVPAIAQQPSAPVAITNSSSTAGRWIPTGNLNVARAGHTATLLTNGKVLVTGGWWISAIASAELYDPASGTWTLTGSMNNPRTGHTATLLPSGKVLVVGGDVSNEPPSFGRTSTAELYDPSTGTWTFAASLITQRCCHTATLLPNGRVLVAGGYGNTDSVKTAELYDPTTDTWSLTGNLIEARYWHTATLLQDGRVLVVRGSDDGDLGSALSSAELYDPPSGTWTATQDSGAATVMHTATLLPDGKVLVAGGLSIPHGEDLTVATSSVFDPATGRWSAVGSLGVPRQGHTATLLPNGQVLVAGGGNMKKTFPGGFEYGHPIATEAFDSSSGTWTDTANLGASRASHTATLLQDGRVLIAGGGESVAFATAELYGNFPLDMIVPAFTGSWFDPAQSGHGILIEVLPGNRMLAAWFAFDPAGTQQSWFTGVGTYSGNAATISNVIRPSGGRWIPNFDSSHVVDNPWGTLKFTFTDCNHGKVEFASTSGYGTGSMNLTRLTQPAGLTCP